MVQWAVDWTLASWSQENADIDEVWVGSIGSEGIKAR